MDVRVTFMGVFASVTNEKEHLVHTEATITLRQLLELLEEHYGEDFGRRVFRSQTPPRMLQSHTRIFINGNPILNDVLDQSLHGGPEVLIYLLPASTGG